MPVNNIAVGISFKKSLLLFSLISLMYFFMSVNICLNISVFISSQFLIVDQTCSYARYQGSENLQFDTDFDLLRLLPIV
ncbi:GSCOCG00007361001-RA-CDS [Cotesia congregata]|nr:GSCOCG00007361001-RA-CDS [Cotesia congregata]